MIRDRGLGWAITDYGDGRFSDMGLFPFTTRNGTIEDLNTARGMLYAEKIVITRRNQLSSMRRHDLKAEDIINRGGGDLVIELFAPDAHGGMDDAAQVTVPCDGVNRTVDAGGRIALKPGESVTLMPGVWHAFWAEGKDCLVGEVSTVNDDKADNVYRELTDRFSDIDEDAAPNRLLVSDY